MFGNPNSTPTARNSSGLLPQGYCERFSSKSSKSCDGQRDEWKREKKLSFKLISGLVDNHEYLIQTSLSLKKVFLQ